MIMDTTNPSQIVLQILAQYLDGTPKTVLSTATVRVYHIESESEVEDLTAVALGHTVGTNTYRYIWKPTSLPVGTYIAEYTLTDLDGVTAVFPEDIVISESSVCPTVEDIDDKLSDEHGDGSWEGSGSNGRPKLIPGE